MGLFPLALSSAGQSCGNLEGQGLHACRFSSQPCVQTVPPEPSAAVADGALELAVVEMAACLGLSTSPQPTATSLVITSVSLGLV